MGEPLQQQDLFDNITDVIVEYKDARHGFWRVGKGVRLEYDRRKKITVAVIHPLAGRHRDVKVPFSLVRVHGKDSTNGATDAPVSRNERTVRTRRAR